MRPQWTWNASRLGYDLTTSEALSPKSVEIVGVGVKSPNRNAADIRPSPPTLPTFQGR
jgi:hypothetical protein